MNESKNILFLGNENKMWCYSFFNTNKIFTSQEILEESFIDPEEIEEIIKFFLKYDFIRLNKLVNGTPLYEVNYDYPLKEILKFLDNFDRIVVNGYDE